MTSWSRNNRTAIPSSGSNGSGAALKRGAIAAALSFFWVVALVQEQEVPNVDSTAASQQVRLLAGGGERADAHRDTYTLTWYDRSTVQGHYHPDRTSWTWSDAKNFCATQGQGQNSRLCTRDEYCPDGPGTEPIGGRRRANAKVGVGEGVILTFSHSHSWAASSDGPHTWVQVGTWENHDGRKTCQTHAEAFDWNPDDFWSTEMDERYFQWIACCDDGISGSSGASSSSSSHTRRPVMHTFFAPLETMSAGMSKAGHQALLEAWKKAWFDAGFEPKVLTLDDARRHRDFDTVNDMLQRDFPRMSEYDRMCFLRWFAMAASGGGWMSDYDAFPLHINATYGATLPNNGTFTGHSSHIPSLVSGTASEWERMASTLIQTVQRSDFKFFVSDMHALVYLTERAPDTFLSRYDVCEWFFYAKPREVLCVATVNKLAIHFSHNRIMKSVREGLLEGMIRRDAPYHDAMEVRWKVAEEFMGDWSEQCISHPVEETNAE